MEFQDLMRCRLCDKNITGKEGLLLFDYNENVETQLGRKFSIIMNSSYENKENLSNYCCEFCTSKIEICFGLLIEIQASDQVIRQTYHSQTNGRKIDAETQEFICGECSITMTGIKSFIKHYENHILMKTIIGSKNDMLLDTFCTSESQGEIIEFKEEIIDDIKEEENCDSQSYEDNFVLPFSNTEIPDNLEQIVNEDELNDSEDKSVDSFQTDTSLKNLMNIARVELEKSDDESSIKVQPNEDGSYSCDVCKLNFQYKFVLKLHLKTNHQSYHDLDVSYIKDLLDNLENDIEDEVYVKCCYCNETFTAEELKFHVLNCVDVYETFKKNILCQVCGRLFSFENLDKHLETHKKECLSCEHCNKKFKTKRFLRSHLGEHDESKKKMCEICGEKFLPLVFFNHMAKHREKRHVCEICGKAFTYNYGLRLHLRVHENKVIDKKYEKKKDKIFCWLCKKVFDNTISLNKHLKNEHNADGVEQDSRFSCKSCNKKFADMFSLKAHLKLIHELGDEEISQLKSLPVYRYIECNVCNKIFNSENKIRIHMKQDHGLKPFEMEILKKECEKCGKKFASKQNLIHHINSAHLHIKPMTCDICQEKFAKHSSLIYHKLRHSGEKPFQCEFCRKSYRQRNDVIRHLARHVRDKELKLEEASAVNNSPSRLVMKRRIFLKDSSIKYQTIVRKSKRKSEAVEIEPILEEEISEIQEEQMDFTEDAIAESMIYVEEIPVEEIQSEDVSEVQYIDAKPIYNEERNTIILSSPDVVNNSVKNVTYRYIPSQLKHMPAVIVKKQEQF